MKRSSGRKTPSKNLSKRPRKRRRSRPREILAQTLSKTRTRPRLRGRQLFRFTEVKGKTVEFVEMCADSEFPSIDISFEDKTALHFTIDAGLTMEPVYSDWKTGERSIIRRWTAR